MREGARGRLKATPLTIQGKVEAYTSQRTSKVVYQSETLSPVLAAFSRTVELATGMRLRGELSASENYQVTQGRLSGLKNQHRL